MLPSLRERREDIPFLARHFLEEFALKNSRPVMAVAPEALQLMTAYSWNGNVRELRNLVERIVVLKEGDTIAAEDLPVKMRLNEEAPAKGREKFLHDEGISFQEAVSEFEKALILSALEKANWVKNRAADLLKIKRTTLVEKIKRYNLDKSSEE
jgi:DNA-binding NtrC family response regulator